MSHNFNNPELRVLDMDPLQVLLAEVNRTKPVAGRKTKAGGKRDELILVIAETARLQAETALVQANERASKRQRVEDRNPGK
jgi:hypothetical protein